jgi:L-methionine (R)-S-oxide reductase
MSDHEAVLAEVRAAIEGERDATEALRATVQLLESRMADYTWVGIYLCHSNELVLGPFVGKPSPHTRIPLGRGICGAAASEKATVIVDDVNEDPRYLACSAETRSEIVVPILSGGVANDVLGEIDVDSDRPAAFGPRDQEMLEAIARLLAPRLTRA